MRFSRLLFSTTVMFAAVVAPGKARAQTVEQAVRAPIDQLFAGMKARDTMMIRDAFVPAGRLIDIRTRNGATEVSSLTPADFAHGLLGAPAGVELLEKIWAVEIKVEDNVAHAWMQYSFHLGPRFSHCGIDAAQLAKTTTGWKIVQLMDTRRTTGCVGEDGKPLSR